MSQTTMMTLTDEMKEPLPRGLLVRGWDNCVVIITNVFLFVARLTLVVARAL